MSVSQEKNAGRIVLHIGTHKTGSTSLQSALAHHEATLLGQHIRLLSTGRNNDGHHSALCDGLSPIIRNRETLRRARRLWREVILEIGATSEDTVVITSEEFSVLDLFSVRFVAHNLLQTGRTVQIVLYVREQLSALRSHYVELLKQGFLEVDFEQHLALSSLEYNKVQSLRAWDYQILLAKWIGVFGKSSVTVLPWTRNTDTVTAFLRLLQLDLSIDGECVGRLNESPNSRVVAALLLGNRYLANCAGLTKERRTQIAYSLYNWARARYRDDAESREFPLNKQWENRVRKKYVNSNKWLSMNFSINLKPDSVFSDPKIGHTNSLDTLGLEEVNFWIARMRQDLEYSLELV